MSDDTPTFSSIPLEEESPPKKPTRKKREKAIKPAPENKPPKKKIQDSKQIEIDKQITSIYQDSDGQLPDMTKIKIRKSHPILKFFFFLIVAGVLLAGVAWAGLFLLPGSSNFSQDQVSLDVSGPADVVSGATTTYTLTYKNNQDIGINSVVLNIQYPEGFVFSSSDLPATNTGHSEWSLGNLAPHQKQQLNITGVTYGSVGEQQSWRAFLTYQPDNFKSDLQKAYVLNVNFSQSPFSLSVTGPDKATIGNVAQYAFTVTDEIQNQISGLELKPDFPDNFYIVSSSPSLNKSNSWTFNPSASSSTGATGSPDTWTFNVAGRFSSSSQPTAPIGGTLNISAANSSFKIAESSLNTQLVQNNLAFSVTINSSTSNLSMQPGNMLDITVDFTNLSGGNMKNAVLKLDMDAPSLNRQGALDWSQIADKYDGDIKGSQLSDSIRRGEIVWDKNKIPDLALIKPNQDITVDLTLPLKNTANFDYSSLQNFNVSANAGLNFTDQTGAAQSFSANPITITLNSDLKMETRDSVSADASTHDVTWVLTNDFHPLKNLTLTANVYGDVGVIIDTSTPPAGQVNYDQQNKVLSWTIPDMPQEVNVLALPFTIKINKANPSQDTLVSKVHVQADDTVTGQHLDLMGDEILLSR